MNIFALFMQNRVHFLLCFRDEEYSLVIQDIGIISIHLKSINKDLILKNVLSPKLLVYFKPWWVGQKKYTVGKRGKVSKIWAYL